MSMEMPESREARTAEVKRLLEMYHRDIADQAEGGGRMTPEDQKRTEEEVAKLEKELEELERGA